MLARVQRTLIALAVALAFVTPAPVPAAGPTIRVGLVCGSLTPLLADVAFPAGSFTRAGISVEKDCFSSGPAAVQALVGRSLDVFIGSYDHVLRQRARGLDVKAYAQIYDGYSYDLLAKSSSSIHGLADLKGQTVGITAPGSLSDAALRDGLEAVHLNPDRDVQILAAGTGATMIAALDSGRVVAGMLTEPSISQLVADRAYRVVWSSNQPYPGNVVMASASWVAANRPAFATFLRVLADERARIERNPTSALEPLRGDFPKVPSKVMLEAVRHQLTHIPRDLHFVRRGADAVETAELRSGEIKTPIPFAQAVDETLLPKTH